MTPIRRFGQTWWGKAWIAALEGRARLDPNRLPRGRTYARSGKVGRLTVEPGEVRAPVRGSRPSVYQVRVRVRVFNPAEWDRLLGAVAARVGHAAGLLEGELDPELVRDAASAGIELLPGPGELTVRCSCPDWADPCKHAAAVCYLIADLVDGDPFVVFLLRGKRRDDVLDALRNRRVAPAAGPVPTGADQPAATAAGHVGRGPAIGRVAMSAADAWARSPGPCPEVPLPPSRPGQPGPLVPDPPRGAPAGSAVVAPSDLESLGVDAARRAWELSTGAGDGGLGLGLGADLARRAASRLGGDSAGLAAVVSLARRAGVDSKQLTAEAMAWQEGGPGGYDATGPTWPADPDDLEAGREALRAAGLSPVRARGNQLTAARAGVQLRLGRDGLWYRFRRGWSGWELAGAGDADPSALLAGMTRASPTA